MKTAAQKYSESNAEAILAYFRGVDGTFVPTPAHPSPRYPMVDDTVGIHTVRLSQSTLAGYLEQAFVAGERAEFDRLDKLIIESKLVPCPYCSEGDPGQCGACHNTRRVMLSQQLEYSLHIRPVPNSACPECIADKLIAGAEKDSEKDGSVRCPQCKGYDEYCMFCEGTGMVTACQSREWLVQNPATERSL